MNEHAGKIGLLAGLALVFAVIVIFHPAIQSTPGNEDTQLCVVRDVPKGRTNFLTGFYLRLCETLSEPRPVADNEMILVPIVKPVECATYSPSPNFITPNELLSCQLDRWQQRQRWTKCRLGKPATDDEQADRAVSLLLSGKDTTADCGPFTARIQIRATTASSCAWPLCPFWSLAPNASGRIGLGQTLDTGDYVGPDADSLALCADLRNTINAMIGLYEADPAGYKGAPEYQALKKHLDDSDYPALPCPAE
jgi:hypothetical protein